MSQIYIKGKPDPIRVTNTVGREIKKLWLGDDNVEPADKNRVLDLGDAWAGVYGQIKSIEIDPEYKPTKVDEDINKPETDADREKRRLGYKRVRESLESQGIISKKTEL